MQSRDLRLRNAMLDLARFGWRFDLSKVTITIARSGRWPRRQAFPRNKHGNSCRKIGGNDKKEKRNKVVDVFISDMLLTNEHNDVVYRGKPTHCQASI